MRSEDIQQRNTNQVNQMRMYGVSEVTIADTVYENKILEIQLMEREKRITPQQAARMKVEALEERDRKNLDSMKRGGVSQTTINSEMGDSKLRSINAREEGGLISKEEALKQRAEAIHDRDLKNIEIMRSGGVSQATINSEAQRAEERYQQLLNEAQNMRGENTNTNNDQMEGILKSFLENLNQGSNQ